MIAADFHKRSFQDAQLKLIPPNRKGRGSSVVERIIGNDEVGSSILPRGTSFSLCLIAIWTDSRRTGRLWFILVYLILFGRCGPRISYRKI